MEPSRTLKVASVLVVVLVLVAPAFFTGSRFGAFLLGLVVVGFFSIAFLFTGQHACHGQYAAV